MAKQTSTRQLIDENSSSDRRIDPATQLPNSQIFHDRLGHEITRAKRSELPLALLRVAVKLSTKDGDEKTNFSINSILPEITYRLVSCIRESDTVSYLDDVFVLILPEIRDRSVDSVSHKIIDELCKQYEFNSQVVTITVNVGISFYPDDANDVETLYKNTEQAILASKKKDKNHFEYFTQSMQDAAQKKLRMSNDLKQALNDKQFEIYYQPIVNIRSGVISKGEALLRWHHPLKGLLNPMEFLSIAEETGLMHDIGDWVFQEAVDRERVWKQSYKSEFQIAINMSPVQFKKEYQLFETEWFNALQRAISSGANIIIEVTEALLQDVDSGVIDKMILLREAGLEIAIDDFGTAQSSLTNINKIRVNYIKIDRKLVASIEGDQGEAVVCDAIIAMAHKLGLKVIAEGVETEVQEKILTDAGCDFAQGYLYSTPVPAIEFEQLLKDGCRQIDIL